LRCRGFSTCKEEQDYRDNMQKIYGSIKKPYSDIQVLMSKQAQQEKQEDIYEKVEDEKDLETILELLQSQRKGLEHLSNVLK
jgi:hypothetical protein